MNLIDAAQIVERLQRRAAHEGELLALRMARDAILTIVSEGYSTLDERLGRPRALTGRPGYPPHGRLSPCDGTTHAVAPNGAQLRAQ